MEDMVIKGTGNSRWLKSVANIMTLYPTYESFAEALAAGTFPIDLNGINPAGVETSGTRLNKANLLTDALCTALGIATTSTPTQAMEKLRLLVNQAQQDAVRDARVAVGAYVGTGTSLNKKSLLLPFSPKMVIISELYTSDDSQTPLNTAVFSNCGGFSVYTAYPAGTNVFYTYAVGNTFYWQYPSGNASDIIMLNRTHTYSYVCFG